MFKAREFMALGLAAWLAGAGCTVKNLNFGKLSRPQRASQLDAYDVFVGSWTWEAKVLNAEGADAAWRGTAKWEWTLDRSCLSGRITAESAGAKFDSAGLWSWHPKSRKYMWTMFNNWGYPQSGTASYNEATKKWRMSFTSIGLDGTTSYGRYEMTVIDNNTLDWRLEEWADPLHLVRKLEMTGTYKRQN